MVAADVTAVLSMLHEPANHNSATRPFRGRPVLWWTLRRLGRSARVGCVAVLCWDDQRAAIAPLAGPAGATVLGKGPRVVLPHLEAIAASRRWSDGWRGGLLGTCDFDQGFCAAFVRDAAESLGSAAVLLIDPASGLVDPALIDALVDHAGAREEVEICIAPAAPGLCGALIRRPLLDRLVAADAHPGRLMHYHPDRVSREPLAGDSCAPVPTIVARAAGRFTLSSDRQVERLSAAFAGLNGQLIGTGAEELVRRSQAHEPADALPREVVLELNTNRLSRPIYWPGRHVRIERRELSLALARTLFAEIRAPCHPAQAALAPGAAGSETSDRSDIHQPGLAQVPRYHRAQTGTTLGAERSEAPDASSATRRGIAHGHLDETRLTLAGVGDPLLAANVFDIIEAAADAGLSIHVETDLLGPDIEAVRRLAASPVDVVSVHLPALTAETYQMMMGIDGYARVLDHIRAFVAERAARRRGVPLLVPIFTKCRENLGEMEPWYDQWLRALGSAVIAGPSDHAGLIPDAGVADMTPPRRRACARLFSRAAVLSDGRIVSCEQDVLGRQAMGKLGADTLREIWAERFGAVRAAHATGSLRQLPLCVGCKQWHRP